VHVLVKGRIVASGGSELADELEVAGYAAYLDGEDAGPADALADIDPFAEPPR
jgi:hypothetical protein